MVCTSLLCDKPLPRNKMQGTRFTAPIRTKPESVSSPCVQEPYSSPFDDRLWGPSSPLCSTATGVKARERWAGHKIPYAGEVQNS